MYPQQKPHLNRRNSELSRPASRRARLACFRPVSESASVEKLDALSGQSSSPFSHCAGSWPSFVDLVAPSRVLVQAKPLRRELPYASANRNGSMTSSGSIFGRNSAADGLILFASLGLFSARLRFSDG